MGQMLLAGSSVTLLLFINTIGASVIPLRDLHFTSARYSQSPEAHAEDSEYRLPKTVTPLNYKVILTPDFDDFTFAGEVSITVAAESNGVNNISLHYDNITIHNVIVTDEANNTLNLTEPTYNSETNIYTIIPEEELTAGNYIIYITYTGHLLDDMAGFYRSSYITADNEQRWLATTQFEPTDARRAFPCFDEPGLKAHFKIYIRRPSTMNSTSNMPLEDSVPLPDGLVEDIFEETPLISTYLVAFIVSDFKNLSRQDANHLYNIWVREDALNQANYSLSISPGIIKYLERFTEIDFEFSKMDQAAIPDFSAGAMENWGLVTYRERLLLFTQAESTTSSKQNIATVIAHEFGHQWFGDLVSPAWWDYLWLNEGFATYFEYFATIAVEPTWRLAEQFVVDVHQGALGPDASNTTHPITASVNTPAQISSIFDTISYSKAGSIIRTAEHFLTHETFVKGLGKYLNNRKYQAATADDLFSALQEEAVADGVFSDPDLNVPTILKSWTTQPGYPYIEVHRTEDGIHISQKKFLISGETEEPTTTWWTPITYTKKNSIDFGTTKPTVWLKNVPDLEIATELGDDEWIILNIQETAFYRVLYDEVTYKLLADYLNSVEYRNIHALNRAQLLDDSLNLARAGLLSYSTALDITKYLAQDTDFIPWTSYFRSISFLNIRLAGTDDYEKFKTYVLSLLENLYKTVGFHVTEQEEHTRKLIRVTALTWACNFNQDACTTTASEIFANWTSKNDKIPPDLTSVVYCTALSNGETNEWNVLWEKYKSSDVATEQVLLLAALGCTRDVDQLWKYLNHSITEDSGIRRQDSQSVFSAVYNRPEGVDVALNFLIQNFDEIQQYYTAMNALGNIISGIASRLTTPEQQAKLIEFVSLHGGQLGPAQSAANTALETVAANLAWFDTYSEEISTWLNYSPASPDAATALSFHPIMCFVILIGYLVAKH